MSGTAAGDYDEATEDKGGSEDLLPGEGVHADGYADSYGNDGLDVAVHADKSRSDALLCHRDEEVCYECGADDQVGEFGILL